MLVHYITNCTREAKSYQSMQLMTWRLHKQVYTSYSLYIL